MQYVFSRSSISSTFLSLVVCLAIASCGTAPGARIQDPAAQAPSAPQANSQDPLQGESEPDATLDKPSHASLDLGVANTGISFGNSQDWSGIRFNWRDRDAQHINGLNVTLWSPRGNGIDEFQGVAVGVAPSARSSSGIRAGLVATISDSTNGIEVAGITSVAQGDATGFRIAGIATVAEGASDGVGLAGIATVTEGRSRGLHLAGIATVSDGGMQGIHAGALAAVSGKDMLGIQAGGLATISGRDMLGLQVAGLATVAEGSIAGVSAAGLAVVAEHDLTGLHVAGLATISEGPLFGIGASGLATVSEQSITGIEVAGLSMVADEGVRGIGVAGLFMTDPKHSPWDLMPLGPPLEESSVSINRGLLVAGLRVDATNVAGVTVAGLINRSHDFDGVGISAHNSVSGMQRGLQVGVFNYAEDLRGVQVGLLNYVPSNPWYLRWMPLVNFRF